MKKLLIVVDYQNDFVTGILGFPMARMLDTPIAKKIVEYRLAGDLIAFTYDTHYSNYLYTQEGKNLPVAHCIKNTKGWQLYGKVGNCKKAEDNCFYKATFGSDKLYKFLKTSTFKQIEFVGIISNICVISNAILAKTALPEALITVDKCCTASNDSLLNAAALNVMSSLQIEVK